MQGLIQADWGLLQVGYRDPGSGSYEYVDEKEVQDPYYLEWSNIQTPLQYQYDSIKSR